MSILVGTAGWADRELIASGWYPAQAHTPPARLRYYAEQFPLVEVDSSYYAIPRRSTVDTWARTVPASFVMDVKAYSLLTGHRTRIASLPVELRGSDANGKAWISAGTAPDALVKEAWRWFHDAIQPLRQAGRLGMVVLQFPPMCRPGPVGQRQVEDALVKCAPLQAAVEFRHGSWLAPEQRDRTMDLLRAHNAAFVCVDMPQAHANAMPPLVAATADKAVIRLHGRSEKWVGGSKEERYRYEYTPDELAWWAQQARELAQVAEDVHVVVNTCCAGAAQRTAAELRDLLAAS